MSDRRPKANWPSTGRPPAAAARSPCWRSTRRSSTWPRPSTSSSGRWPWTPRSATSRRCPTAASTSASSTAASAPASRSTWPNCSAGRPRSWWPSAPAPTRAAFPGWPTPTTAARSSTPSITRRPRPRIPTASSRSTKTPMPEGTLHLPVFYDTLRTLDQTVAVDYYLPGCPPEAERIWDAITAIVGGEAAAAGLGDRRQDDRLPRVPAEAEREEDQEVLPHLGDHARRRDVPAGAGAAVLRASPRGPAAGPSARRSIRPASAATVPTRASTTRAPRMMTALASVIDSNDPEEIDRIIREGIPDPVGTFLSLQPGREPPAAGERARPATADGQRLALATGATSRTETTPMKRISIDPVTRWKATARSTSSSTSRATWPTPTCRSRSCAASSSSAWAGRPRTCPTSPPGSAASAPRPTTWRPPRPWTRVFHVDPPPAAKKLRELFYSIFYATDHTTHFYALGGPDFVVGPTAPAAERNILGVVKKVGMDIAGKVLKMRRDGHAPDRDDRRPGRASQLGPARRRQPRHQRGAAPRDRGPRPRGRRVRQVLAEALRRRGAEATATT